MPFTHINKIAYIVIIVHKINGKMCLNIFRLGVKMEISYAELRQKTVVNIVDGKNLGHIIDAIFDDAYGKLLGFVVPSIKRNFFKSNNDIFIPYQNICKIGSDVILVELLPQTAPASPPPPKDEPRTYAQTYQTKVQATNWTKSENFNE